MPHIPGTFLQKFYFCPNKCTPWHNTHNIYKICYMFRHPEDGTWVPKHVADFMCYVYMLSRSAIVEKKY